MFVDYNIWHYLKDHHGSADGRVALGLVVIRRCRGREKVIRRNQDKWVKLWIQQRQALHNFLRTESCEAHVADIVDQEGPDYAILPGRWWEDPALQHASLPPLPNSLCSCKPQTFVPNVSYHTTLYAQKLNSHIWKGTVVPNGSSHTGGPFCDPGILGQTVMFSEHKPSVFVLKSNLRVKTVSWWERHKNLSEVLQKHSRSYLFPSVLKASWTT